MTVRNSQLLKASYGFRIATVNLQLNLELYPSSNTQCTFSQVSDLTPLATRMKSTTPLSNDTVHLDLYYHFLCHDSKANSGRRLRSCINRDFKCLYLDISVPGHYPSSISSPISRIDG